MTDTIQIKSRDGKSYVYIPQEVASVVGLYRALVADTWGDRSRSVRTKAEAALATVPSQWQPYMRAMLDAPVPDRPAYGEGGVREDAAWALTEHLAEMWRAENPPTPLSIEQDDKCRHGQPFTVDCADCDLDA